MSRMGQWRIELQETADYEDGRQAFRDGVYRPGVRGFTAKTAYDLGWEDERDDHEPQDCGPATGEGETLSTNPSGEE